MTLVSMQRPVINIVHFQKWNEVPKLVRKVHEDSAVATLPMWKCISIMLACTSMYVLIEEEAYWF